MASTRIIAEINAEGAATSKFAACFSEVEHITDSSRNMGAPECPDITDIEPPVSWRLLDSMAHLPLNRIRLQEQAMQQAIQGKRISGLENGICRAEICATRLQALQQRYPDQHLSIARQISLLEEHFATLWRLRGEALRS